MEAYLIDPAAPTDPVNRMPVTRYPTREAAEAAKRPEQWLVQTEADVPWTGVSLVTAYNGVTGLGLARFESTEVGKRRFVTQLARYAQDAAVAKTDEKSTMSEDETKAADGKRGRQPKYTNAMTITKLNDTNPCRAGTASFDRAALFRTGQTVEEFFAAGGRMSDVHSAIKRNHIAVA